jgi:hypothetical protein
MVVLSKPRKGRRRENKWGEGKYRKGKRRGKKKIEKNRKKGETTKEVNNWLQLWDDNPLQVVKNLESHDQMFNPLGNGVIFDINSCNPYFTDSRVIFIYHLHRATSLLCKT